MAAWGCRQPARPPTFALLRVERHDDKGDDKEARRQVQVPPLARQHRQEGGDAGGGRQEQVIGLVGLLQAAHGGRAQKA